MVDSAVRTAPVPAEAVEFPGVSIALGAPLARWSLRARDAKALAKVVGHKVPAKIGTSDGGMACLGPDEWLLRLPAGATSRRACSPSAFPESPCTVANA